MKAPWHLLPILCCLSLWLPAVAVGSPYPTENLPDAQILPEVTAFFRGNTNLPQGMLELVRASWSKYLEGSDLIKSGDSQKARECFNKAVDLILQSNWDLMSTPSLNRFFEDLVQRIQNDESQYLLVPCEPEDETEDAVIDELKDLDLFPVVVDPALKDSLALELSNHKYEIPITINEMVLKSMDFWLNRGRKYFEEGLIRSGRYRAMIEKIFREESIPLDVMYLAQVESLFKTNALSKAKARGIWQLIKPTALRYGLKVTREVDERSDPEKSTRAAARYLNDLFAMFKDWNLVLAAYNWGEANVKRLVEKTGVSDFWKLIDLKSRIPNETKNHVPLIHASVILARNPGKYGFPTEVDPPLQYTEVSVSKPIDLRAAARILNISIEELKSLNPELRTMTTPANYPNYRLKIPVDADPRVEEQLAALPAAKVRMSPELECRYKVRRGDTLSKIAARYRVSVADLARANNMSVNKKLRIGMWLDVPAPTGATRRTASMPKTPTAKASKPIAKEANRGAINKQNSNSAAPAQSRTSGRVQKHNNTALTRNPGKKSRQNS